MFKKIIICLFVIFLFGCSKTNLEKSDKNVNLNIISGSLNNSGLTLELINNTDYDILVKPGFDIKKDNEYLNKNKKCQNGIGYGIESNSSLDIKVNWSCEYGMLDKGKYTLIKYLDNDEYLSIDFEL